MPSPPSPSFTPRPRRHTSYACVLLLSLSSLAANAQAPAAPGGAAQTGGGGATGGNAPGAGPAPGVSSGLPGTSTAGQTLTLPGVVARVVGNNSGLVIARQRLQRAQESINQVNAQLRPQFRLSGNDTYSSYPAFPATLPVPTITTPTLPDGGQIPTVTDLANNFSTAFIGSNGLGLDGGSGGISPGAVGGTPGVGAPTTGGGGLAPNATGAGGSGAAAPGTGGTAAPGGSPVTGTGPNGAPGTTPNTTGPAQTAPAPGNGGVGGTPAPNGNGGTAPAPGTGTSPGPTLVAYPTIITGYVTDLKTLLQPPAFSSNSPVIRIAAAKGAAGEDAEARPTPKAPGDGTDPTGTGTGTTTAARGLRNTYAAGANVTQYLDVFGLGSAARGSEKDVRDFYALDVTRLQNETALAAKNLFFNVLYAQALVATQQEQVNYAQENVRITESRLRNGVVSRFDVLTAQAALATAQQQLTAAQDEYELTQSELSYLLGTDPDQPQTLQAPPLPALDQTVDVRQSTQIALRQRPELGQAGRNVDNAQKQVRLARSGLLPTLGLVGAAEHTSNASTVIPQDYGTLSAQVAVPLDDGGLTRSRVRSAQVTVQTQAVTQQQIQASVSLEVRQAAINIRNAQAQIGSAEVSVSRSTEALRLARERYGAGLGTFLDVLNALAQLATARNNLANAQYFYQSSLAQLVRAMGGR